MQILKPSIYVIKKVLDDLIVGSNNKKKSVKFSNLQNKENKIGKKLLKASKTCEKKSEGLTCVTGVQRKNRKRQGSRVEKVI